MEARIKAAIIVLIFLVTSNCGPCLSQTESQFDADKVARVTEEYEDADYQEAKYINEEQAAIGHNTKQNWSDLLYFVDTKNSAAPEVATVDLELKAWTEPEKLAISSAINRLWHTAPGLILRASCAHRIALCRSTQGVSNYLAQAYPHAIIFYDCLFSESNARDQLRTMMHELIHCADTADRVAYSQKWINYCNATLIDLRLKLQFSPDSEVTEILSEAVRESPIPRKYSTTNLKEALADIGTESLINPTSDNSRKFITDFGDHLLIQNGNEEKIDWLCRTAVFELRARKLSKAKSKLNQIMEAEPDLSFAHVELAYCLSLQRHFGAALKQANKAAALFSAAGVPPTEKNFLYIRRLQIRCCGHCWKFGKGDQLANETLSVVPFDSTALWFRGIFEDSGAAAYDWYWRRHGAFYNSRFQDAYADPAFVLKKCSQETTQFPNMPAVFLQRGHLLEWFAECEKSAAKKEDLYKQAYYDYNVANNLESTPESLLQCCNIMLKLKQRAAAEKFEIAASKCFPTREETQIMQIQILHAFGHRGAAWNRLCKIEESYRWNHNVEYHSHPINKHVLDMSDFAWH